MARRRAWLERFGILAELRYVFGKLPAFVVLSIMIGLVTIVMFVGILLAVYWRTVVAVVLFLAVAKLMHAYAVRRRAELAARPVVPPDDDIPF